MGQGVALPLERLLKLFGLLLFVQHPHRFLYAEAILQQAAESVHPECILRAEPAVAVFHPLHLEQADLFVIPDLALGQTGHVGKFSDIIALFVFAHRASSLPRSRTARHRFLCGFFASSIVTYFL